MEADRWREPTRLEQLRQLYREQPWRAWEQTKEGSKEAAGTTPLPVAMGSSWLADQARLASM